MVSEPSATPMVMVDAYDLSDPVTVLSKLPKGFDTDIKAAKWSERRDALLALLALLDTPKLADGSYEDLTNSLKQLVSKGWAVSYTIVGSGLVPYPSVFPLDHQGLQRGGGGASCQLRGCPGQRAARPFCSVCQHCTRGLDVSQLTHWLCGLVSMVG